MRRCNRQRPTRAARRKLAVGFQHSALAQRRPAHVQDEQRGDLFISLRQLSGQSTNPGGQRKLRADYRGKRYVRMLCSLLHDAAAGRNEDSDFGWTIYARWERESGRRGANPGCGINRDGLCGAALRTFSGRYLQHHGNPLAELRCTSSFLQLLLRQSDAFRQSGNEQLEHRYVWNWTQFSSLSDEYCERS